MNRRDLIASTVPLLLASRAAIAASPQGKRALPPGMAGVPAGLDAAIRPFLAGGYGVGVSVAAVRSDRVLFAKGYGTANLENNVSTTPASVFRAGSITKQFTAAALMRLVEAGKVDLDAPAAKYVEEMAPLGAITVRMLLNQISGLHNYSGRDFAQQQKIDRTPKELLDYILAQPRQTDFSSGERFEYSNSNYFVLGVLVERVSGRPLADSLNDLLRAAGLTEAAVDRSYDVVPHWAEGYSLIDGKPGRFRKAEYLSMTNAGGAGVLRSTPTDLALWHQALFAGRVVRETSLQQMLATGKLINGQPVYRDDAPIAEGKPAYGFGLEVGMFNGQRAIGHGGSVPGYTSYLVTFPAQHLSIAIMMNVDPSRQMPFNAILRAILGTPSRASG